MAESSPSLRDRLVAAALNALERGEDVSLRAASRDAGVSAMAPYRHYRDKDALLGAVADFGFDKLRAVLLKADQETDPSAALVAQGRAYIAFARAHPQLFRLMFAGHGAGPPPVDDNAYGVLVRRIAELSPGNLEAATLACWSVVHGMATLAVGGTLERQESNLEIEALEMVVRGIQTAPNST